MTFPQPTLHSHSDPRAGLRAEIREEEEMSRLTPIFTFQRLVVSLNINYWNVNNLIDIPLVFQETAKTRREMKLFFLTLSTEWFLIQCVCEINFFLLMQFTPPPKKIMKMLKHVNRSWRASTLSSPSYIIQLFLHKNHGTALCKCCGQWRETCSVFEFKFLFIYSSSSINKLHICNWKIKQLSTEKKSSEYLT